MLHTHTCSFCDSIGTHGIHGSKQELFGLGLRETLQAEVLGSVSR